MTAKKKPRPRRATGSQTPISTYVVYGLVALIIGYAAYDKFKGGTNPSELRSTYITWIRAQEEMAAKGRKLKVKTVTEAWDALAKDREAAVDAFRADLEKKLAPLMHLDDESDATDEAHLDKAFGTLQSALETIK